MNRSQLDSKNRKSLWPSLARMIKMIKKYKLKELQQKLVELFSMIVPWTRLKQAIAMLTGNSS